MRVYVINLKQNYSAEIVKRELLTEEKTQQQAILLQQQHVAQGFILPRAKKAARDVLLRD